MAATSNSQRASSPSPMAKPSHALGHALEPMTRCLSTSSSLSHGSATTQESLGSDFSQAMSSSSRHSSASYASSGTSSTRTSDVGLAAPAIDRRHSSFTTDQHVQRPSPIKRRGYTRPQGTDFAASARSRDSVLSLGSISHLQYYFARTGLLDGKGGQLAAARQRRGEKGLTLDMTNFAGWTDTPSIVTSPAEDTSGVLEGLASPARSIGRFTESPTNEILHEEDEEYGNEDDFDPDESDPNILPPTVSTYQPREKPIPKPPTLEELKDDLQRSLQVASDAIVQAKPDLNNHSALQEPPTSPYPSSSSNEGIYPTQQPATTWAQIQGVHLIDVLTLAIRAAKIYYTCHTHPQRLDAIKPEKQIRQDLLSVMDVLKRMATRNFAGGVRDEEWGVMREWVKGVEDMLRVEEDFLRQEAKWQGGCPRGWEGWCRDEDWAGRGGNGACLERERMFLGTLVEKHNSSLLPSTSSALTLPGWTPLSATSTSPTSFLQALQDGTSLIHLHNAAVSLSTKPFGFIETFHTDTSKPYRCADNLRYWAKAAKLRWEVEGCKIDALGIATATASASAEDGKVNVWRDLEYAVVKWCVKVRGELMSEMGGASGQRP